MESRIIGGRFCSGPGEDSVLESRMIGVPSGRRTGLRGITGGSPGFCTGFWSRRPRTMGVSGGLRTGIRALALSSGSRRQPSNASFFMSVFLSLSLDQSASENWVVYLCRWKRASTEESTTKGKRRRTKQLEYDKVRDSRTAVPRFVRGAAAFNFHDHNQPASVVGMMAFDNLSLVLWTLHPSWHTVLPFFAIGLICCAAESLAPIWPPTRKPLIHVRRSRSVSFSRSTNTTK